jgi:hypothetical protein
VLSEFRIVEDRSGGVNGAIGTCGTSDFELVADFGVTLLETGSADGDLVCPPVKLGELLIWGSSWLLVIGASTMPWFKEEVDGKS